MQRSFRATCLAIAAVLAVGSAAQAQVFTTGNLVIYRVGDGGAALTNAATASFLDQYSIGGSFVNTFNIPSIGGTALTNSGTATSEGQMTLSNNGQYLVFAGYNADAGTAGIAATASTAVQRAAGRVDASGLYGQVLLGTTVYSANNPRGAASTNGFDIWTAGAGTTGGTHYVQFGTPGATQVSSNLTNTRAVNVINGQLYTSSASGQFQGVSTVGTGAPTTTGNTTTILPGFPIAAGPSNYAFVGFDSPTNPNSFNGIDTLYVADDRNTNGSGGLQRWNFDGANWSNSGTITPPDGPGTGFVGLRGLTATISGSAVTLYGTTTEANGNRLVTIFDTLSGLSGTFGSFSTLATAPTNTAFRGLAFAPTPIPEPTSLMLVGFGGVAFAYRRMRRPKG